jgi:murE/murF fusion protein
MTDQYRGSQTVEAIVKRLRNDLGVAASARLVLDSRRCRAGDVFIACSGVVGDGRNFIADAILSGASAVVYETDLTQQQQAQLGLTPAVAVPDLPMIMGTLAHAWWGFASDALTVVAITGTNGKTTTANWLAAALNRLGYPCGVIGTLGVLDPQGMAKPGLLTTPDVISVHECLAHLRDSGATHVVLEASSIGLDQNRLAAVTIDIGVFTNLTQDHLDYHVTMAAYAQAKARLFGRGELTLAVINIDDPWASQMMAAASSKVLTYGMVNGQADVSACQISVESTGTRFHILIGGQTLSLQTAFMGQYNVSNMLAVATVLTHLKVSPADVVTSLQSLPAVAGRLEPVVPITKSVAQPDLPLVLVDYAHTPDALERLLQALRPLAQARKGRLWCVVGCGGNRDASKRPLMARVAQATADLAVFTSDNPRDEPVEAILQEMLAGLDNSTAGLVRVQSDRAVAILTAIWQAKPNDVVVLAGKGHEAWQEMAGVRQPFDDRHWARLALLFKENAPLVQTDSRHLSAHALFVALRGEKFDGHDYLLEAEQVGVVAALVERVVPGVRLPQICVGDTRQALQKFATAWRCRFDIPVIAVTGSNGKTTTKEMIASVLCQWLGEHGMLSTQGNLNNEIGVPLTVLRLRESHRCAVIELGMNHPDEIALLTSIAQPNIGLVLNAQREHQEFMQSVKAVAHENGQVLVGLPADATAVFPADDPFTESWTEQARGASKQLTFGLTDAAFVQAQAIHSDALGSRFVLSMNGKQNTVALSVAGRHNVTNACAAAACAFAAGAPLATIALGLEAFAAVKGRMQVHRLAQDRLLIDDTYNANPDSVRVAIDVLSGLPAPRALVLGDMGEVGDNGAQMHAEVGAYARELAIEYLWTMGEATLHSVGAFGANARSFESVEQLCEKAREVGPMSVLVKGSRFMAMEKVVQQLQKCVFRAQAVKDHHAG